MVETARQPSLVESAIKFEVGVPKVSTSYIQHSQVMTRLEVNKPPVPPTLLDLPVEILLQIFDATTKSTPCSRISLQKQYRCICRAMNDIVAPLLFSNASLDLNNFGLYPKTLCHYVRDVTMDLSLRTLNLPEEVAKIDPANGRALLKELRVKTDCDYFIWEIVAKCENMETLSISLDHGVSVSDRVATLFSAKANARKAPLWPELKFVTISGALSDNLAISLDILLQQAPNAQIIRTTPLFLSDNNAHPQIWPNSLTSLSISFSGGNPVSIKTLREMLDKSPNLETICMGAIRPTDDELPLFLIAYPSIRSVQASFYMKRKDYSTDLSNWLKAFPNAESLQLAYIRDCIRVYASDTRIVVPSMRKLILDAKVDIVFQDLGCMCPNVRDLAIKQPIRISNLPSSLWKCNIFGNLEYLCITGDDLRDQCLEYLKRLDLRLKYFELCHETYEPHKYQEDLILWDFIMSIGEQLSELKLCRITYGPPQEIGARSHVFSVRNLPKLRAMYVFESHLMPKDVHSAWLHALTRLEIEGVEVHQIRM